MGAMDHQLGVANESTYGTAVTVSRFFEYESEGIEESYGRTEGDPLRLGLSWLTKADNVNITDTGAIVKRTGYTLAGTGGYSGAYSTLDFSRAYFVKGGNLVTFPGGDRSRHSC